MWKEYKAGTWGSSQQARLALDKGIKLFEEEAVRLKGVHAGWGGTGHRPVAAGNLPAAPGATYSKRNLPHFEHPWAIYVIFLIVFMYLMPMGVAGFLRGLWVRFLRRRTKSS